MQAKRTGIAVKMAVSGLLSALTAAQPFAASIVLSPGTGVPRTLGENSRTISFTARLDEQPTNDVVLIIGSSDPGAATVSPSEITFSNTTWDLPREVIVRGINDGDVTNETLVILVNVDPAQSDDAFDSAPTQTVSVTVIDDESPPGSPEPSNVLVIYNANWLYDSDGNGVNDSLQVAQYYRDKRGVPASNLLGLNCSRTFQYYYTEDQCNTNWATVFYPEVVEPIWNKVAELGQTNIECLLLCYGVPYLMYKSGPGEILRSIDNALVSLEHLYDSPSTNPLVANGGTWNTAYGAPAPTFQPDAEHFDHGMHTRAGKLVYLVARLDGPSGTDTADYGSLERSLAIVDQCLYADTYLATNSGDRRFTGTAYIDTRYTVGGERYTHALVAADTNVHTGTYNNYVPADRNIGYGARFMEEAGFPLKWENTEGENSIGTAGAFWADDTPATSAPSALWYGGWYNLAGYINAFEWLPGSAGVDLNSFSLEASDIRTPPGRWGTGALADGLSCVAGVLDEPYITGHSRSHVLFYYLFRGYSWAEASILSTPALEWKCINIGDPLYCPMKHGRTVPPDTNSPVMAVGYPYVSLGSGSNEWTIHVMVDDTSAPEVVLADVDYGTSTNYGQTASQGQDGYYRRQHITLASVVAGTTCHYRVTITDPVGNVTVTADYAFDPLDIDGDGLPNSWEQQHFGGATNAIPGADGDGDGLDNYGEWLAGTLPTNAASYFQVTEVLPLAGTNRYVLRWPSISNRLYGVQWTTDLTNSFAPLASNLPATPNLNSYTDTQHTVETRLFYRISVKEE